MLIKVLLALSCRGTCVQMPEQSPAPAGDTSWNFPATSKAQAMAQAQVLSTTLGVPVSTDPSKPPPVGSSNNVSATVTNKVRAHTARAAQIVQRGTSVQCSQVSQPVLPQVFIWSLPDNSHD